MTQDSPIFVTEDTRRRFNKLKPDLTVINASEQLNLLMDIFDVIKPLIHIDQEQSKTELINVLEKLKTFSSKVIGGLNPSI
jgi:hypothetical protein